jgi:hypothetical protein
MPAPLLSGIAYSWDSWVLAIRPPGSWHLVQHAPDSDIRYSGQTTLESLHVGAREKWLELNRCQTPPRLNKPLLTGTLHAEAQNPLHMPR